MSAIVQMGGMGVGPELVGNTPWYVQLISDQIIKTPFCLLNICGDS